MPTDEQPHAALEAHAISRDFGRGPREVHAVRDITLRVEPGEVVAIMGPSGCGKTTLLHLLGGLETPDTGRVTIEGVDWQTLRPRERARLRRQRCGFIFQSLALLPMATAAENVEVPMILDDVDSHGLRKRANAALEQVGLAGKAAQFPDQLSGGEQQRVAIARALINKPAVLLADEPTGSLDSATAMDITRLLISSAQALDVSVVLVTHDERVAVHAHRVLRLASGMLVDDAQRATTQGWQ